MSVSKQTKFIVFFFASFFFCSANYQSVSADFAQSCQLVLKSKSNICGSSGSATYEVFFQNIIPTKLAWNTVNSYGLNQSEEQLIEDAGQNSKNFLIESQRTFSDLTEKIEAGGVAADNNFILAGNGKMDEPGGNTAVLLFKYAASGDAVWEKALVGGNNNYVKSFSNTSDGDTIFTGYSWVKGSLRANSFIVKIDQRGDIVWSREILSDAVSLFGRKIIQTKDSSYLITGTINGFGLGPEEMFVIKVNESGEIVWSKMFAVDNVGQKQNIIEAPDGGYIISTGINQQGKDIVLLKINPSGELVWSKTVESPGDQILNAGVINNALDGYIFVGSGVQYDSGESYVIVIKIDDLGNLIWSKNIRIIGGGSSAPSSIEKLVGEDKYLVTGNNFLMNGNENFKEAFLLEINEDGQISWLKKTDSSSRYQPVYATKLGNQNYFLLGNSYNSDSKNSLFLMKTDQDGNVTGCGGLENTDVSSQNINYTLSNIRVLENLLSIRTNPIIFSSKDIQIKNNNTCYFQSTPSIRKEISFPEEGKYSLNIEAQSAEGDKISCTAASGVNVTSEKRCSIVPDYSSNQDNRSPQVKDSDGYYSFWSGQKVSFKPELFCMEEGGSMKWQNRGGNVVEKGIGSLKMFFETAGTAILKGDYMDTDGNSIPCKEALIKIKEKQKINN